MFRKTIAIALALLLAVTFMPIPTAASAVPTITVGCSDCCRGEYVTVDVSMSGNPGICIFVLSVSYDTTRLELTDASVSPSLPGQTQINSNIVWLGDGEYVRLVVPHA